MSSLARFLLLLSLVIWIGGIVFFSFVVAPIVFSSLSPQASAGQIVSRLLRGLHEIGLTCGVIVLAATFVVNLKHVKGLRALVGLMLLCTALSQFGVTPQMERIREAVGGSIQLLPPKDAGRAAFDHLHEVSVVLEGVVLIAGLGALGSLSREQKE